MIALIQRVKSASVVIHEKRVSKIGLGLLVLIGIGKSDQDSDISYITDKILNLRLFEKNNISLSESVLSSGNEILIVSQFTLYASTRVGKRPDFSQSATSENAKKLYSKLILKLENFSKVKTGIFGEEMDVELVNWGPFTIKIDSGDKDIPRSSF
tara:strand:+ start:136 stop:600 length:465 start_codon:yes stop_codon:yes gene_type:complete